MAGEVEGHRPHPPESMGEEGPKSPDPDFIAGDKSRVPELKHTVGGYDYDSAIAEMAEEADVSSEELQEWFDKKVPLEQRPSREGFEALVRGRIRVIQDRDRKEVVADELGITPERVNGHLQELGGELERAANREKQGRYLETKLTTVRESAAAQLRQRLELLGIEPNVIDQDVQKFLEQAAELDRSGDTGKLGEKMFVGAAAAIEELDGPAIEKITELMRSLIGKYERQATEVPANTVEALLTGLTGEEMESIIAVVNERSSAEQMEDYKFRSKALIVFLTSSIATTLLVAANPDLGLTVGLVGCASGIMVAFISGLATFFGHDPALERTAVENKLIDFINSKTKEAAQVKQPSSEQPPQI